jgi:hypothetical protein
MRRLKDCLKVVVWQAGLGYLAIWAITFWTLDDGPRVYGGSGVCYPDAAKVLFYWVCEPTSPLAIIATLSNVALTVTVWAPVYVAAATVQTEAMAIALPIIAVHMIGLPAGLFVLIRLTSTALAARRLWSDRGHTEALATAGMTDQTAPGVPVACEQALDSHPRSDKIKSRAEFGMRSCKRTE